MTKHAFADLGLSLGLVRALETERYNTPTPIQALAIPPLIDGKDALGLAQTGTGKTAAFALPILHKLAETRERRAPAGTRALILAPTRELVIQIAESFTVYGRNLRLNVTAIVGGVAQGPQRKAMASGTDILVATPGRLLDLMGQGHVRLDRVSHLVVDEADRMLDMGFIRDVRTIIAAMPKRRQSLMFSATMPADVERLARDMLADPILFDVEPEAVAVDRIKQGVIHTKAAEKPGNLTDLLADPALARVIVFTRTKHRANRVADHLDRSGISADALHGNKSQSARQRALESFRTGKVRVLVATDIAARGIDVDDITHVINFELPSEADSYVHRIGRTARAGAAGNAISLCDEAEMADLRNIERTMGCRITVLDGREPRKDASAAPVAGKRGDRRSRRPRRRRYAVAA